MVDDLSLCDYFFADAIASDNFLDLVKRYIWDEECYLLANIYTFWLMKYLRNEVMLEKKYLENPWICGNNW